MFLLKNLTEKTPCDIYIYIYEISALNKIKEGEEKKMLSLVVSLLKSSFKRVGFWAALTLMMILCMSNTVVWAFLSKDSDVSQQIANANAFILEYGSPLLEALLMAYIFILLLPYVFTFRRDRRLQMQQVLIVRMGKTRYYIANVIACFASTFIAMLVPLLIENFVNGLIFKNTVAYSYSFNSLASITGDNVMIDTYSNGYPFVDLYMKSPMNYNYMCAFIFALLCGILAVFVFSISFYVKKYGILLLLPLFILVQLQDRVDAVIQLQSSIYLNVNIRSYFTVGMDYGQSALYIILFCIVLLTISFFLTLVKCKGDQLE